MSVVLRLCLNTLTRCKYYVSSRFATKTSRFRLAVSTGFVIATAGFLMSSGTRFGDAQSIWGILGLPEGGQQAPQVYGEAPQPSPQYRSHRRHARVARRDDDARPVRGRSARGARGASATPVALVGKSMCVRLCDGFVFPVGNYSGDGDRVAHEATCQSECPGAKTALFVMPGGSDSIADATEVGTGRNYSKMPDAFHYTTFVDQTCSCHPQEGGRTKSLLRDFTLRRGDTVMTQRGLQVFHGGNGFPFKRKDFVALSKSRDIRSADRASLNAIERASLVVPTRILASKAPSRSAPAMTSDGRRTPTKGLEHQAQN